MTKYTLSIIIPFILFLNLTSAYGYNIGEDNPLLAAIITEPESTPEAKQYAQQIQLNYIADQLGIEKSKLLIYNSDILNYGVASESKGLFVKKTGDIYLNTGEIAENETLATTLGHEILHAIEQAKNKNYGEAYADLMGENLNNALNTELKIYGYIPVTYNVRTNEQWRELYNDDPLIINNNYTAGLFGYDEVEQKVLEYFDYRYWQAVRAGNIKEANRIKAEWDKTEQTILNNTQLTLDATGMLDPTPISDGTNALISILRKNYIEAGLSAASIIPIAGDILGKGGKLGLKYGDEIGDVASKQTKLYRAVSEAEFDQIIKTGKFNVGPNSLGGKFFAESINDAKKWGDILNGNGKSVIVEVELPKDVADSLKRWERLDGIGPARYGELDKIGAAVIKEVR